MSRYYNDFSDVDTGEDELEHYGVLGMKWGVRKQISSTAWNTTRKVNGAQKSVRSNIASKGRAQGKAAFKANSAFSKGKMNVARQATKTQSQAVHKTGQALHKGQKSLRSGVSNWGKYQSSALHKERSVLHKGQMKAVSTGLKLSRQYLTPAGKIKLARLASEKATDAGKKFLEGRKQGNGSVGVAHAF